MALTKTATTAMQYQNNASSPVAISYTAPQVVQGTALVFDHHITRPGVFTAGTPQEAYGTNVTNDSNS